MTDSKLPGALVESRLNTEKCLAWQILGMSDVPTARPEAPLVCVTVAPPAKAGLISTPCSSRSTSPSTICSAGQAACRGASPSFPTRSSPVWRWPKSCSAAPPNTAGLASPSCGWAISSPTCPSSPATTSACGRSPLSSVGFFGILPSRRLLSATGSACWMPPRSPVPAAERPWNPEVAEALLDGSPLEEGQIIVCDKGFADRFLQARVAELGATLLRPDRKDEPARYGSLGPVRQWIESIIDTLKGQLSLEEHGGRTPAGVMARVAQRLLALGAGVWWNWQTSAPEKRSLVAYDH